jgi:hypothetical protein
VQSVETKRHHRFDQTRNILLSVLLFEARRIKISVMDKKMCTGIIRSRRRAAREKEKKTRSGSCLPIPSFVVTLFLFEIDKRKIVTRSLTQHRMGDDRNQLVPGSTGEVTCSHRLLSPHILLSLPLESIQQWHFIDAATTSSIHYLLLQ